MLEVCNIFSRILIRLFQNIVAQLLPVIGATRFFPMNLALYVEIFIWSFFVGGVIKCPRLLSKKCRVSAFSCQKLYIAVQ